MLNPKNQKIIKKLYLDNLFIKFDYNLFSSLVLYDMIDIEQGDYFNIFINDIDIPNERVANRTIFQKPKFNRYSKLDDLINICFKCNIDLNDKRFSKFKKINNYYKWLFNIDGYDYKNFDPFWIDVYDTIWYHKHFKKSIILKNKINQILVDDYDLKLKNIYFKIFCID